MDGEKLASDTKNRLKYSFQLVFNAVPALHFRDDKVSIAKTRLVPITVSQLKCALHILIGEWYDPRSAPCSGQTPDQAEVRAMIKNPKNIKIVLDNLRVNVYNNNRR